MVPIVGPDSAVSPGAGWVWSVELGRWEDKRAEIERSQFRSFRLAAGLSLLTGRPMAQFGMVEQLYALLAGLIPEKWLAIMIDGGTVFQFLPAVNGNTLPANEVHTGRDAIGDQLRMILDGLYMSMDGAQTGVGRFVSAPRYSAYVLHHLAKGYFGARNTGSQAGGVAVRLGGVLQAANAVGVPDHTALGGAVVANQVASQGHNHSNVFRRLSEVVLEKAVMKVYLADGTDRRELLFEHLSAWVGSGMSGRHFEYP